MHGKKRFGRRYSYRTPDGELLDPHDWNDARFDIYNPSNLKHDAVRLGDIVGRDLGVELVLVKHLAHDDRDEALLGPVWGRR